MIPVVLATDLLFALVAAGLYRLAPTRWTRRLTATLFVYTLIEAAFHVPMEDLAGRIFF